MIRTHGNWSPSDDRIVFAPGNFGGTQAIFSGRSIDAVKGTPIEPLWHLALKVSKQMNKLISVLDLSTTNWQEQLQMNLTYCGRVFLDSGVFGLAMRHAKLHGLTHNEALNVPIDQIDGWSEFFELYVAICTHYKDSLWGYVELDLGGTDQKIKTRALLESKGLAPIPVWHPLTDGLEYGKMLMQTYERICVGNLVKSDEDTRRTVLRMVAHVKGSNRLPWVHALGLAPVSYAACFPINSLDAITWISALMYPKRQTYALMHKFEIDAARFYGHRDQYFMAAAMLQRQVLCNQQNWRNYEASKAAAGVAGQHLRERKLGRVPRMAASPTRSGLLETFAPPSIPLDGVVERRPSQPRTGIHPASTESKKKHRPAKKSRRDDGDLEL